MCHLIYLEGVKPRVVKTTEFIIIIIIIIIPYRERPKSPPFQFFSALETFFSEFFFRNFFSSKGPPCIFLMFCDRMDVGKSQRVPPFSFFRHCKIFSRKQKKISSIFSCFATEWMLKNLKGSPLSVFRHCETLARWRAPARHSVHFFEPWIWRRLGPVPAC